MSVRLARQLADVNPDQAKEILDQLGTDLQDAVQELRNLAHGIYPPLLMDRGLAEALARRRRPRRAADRRSRRTGIGRYPQPVEAAVYFCVLEALQNAGKHAGDGAQVDDRAARGGGCAAVRRRRRRRGLRPGDRARTAGHGFVNMSDRVGAFGGSISVDSAPGRGTRISGRLPLGGS